MFTDHRSTDIYLTAIGINGDRICRPYVSITKYSLFCVQTSSQPLAYKHQRTSLCLLSYTARPASSICKHCCLYTHLDDAVLINNYLININMSFDIKTAYATEMLSEPEKCRHKSCSSKVSTCAVKCTNCARAYHPACAVKAKVANNVEGYSFCTSCQEDLAFDFVVPTLCRSKSPKPLPPSGSQTTNPLPSPLTLPTMQSQTPQDFPSHDLRDLLIGLKTSVDGLTTTVGALSDQFNRIESRVGRVESQITSMQDSQADLTASVAAWGARFNTSEAQLRPLVENLQSTCNLLISEPKVTKKDVESTTQESRDREHRSGNVIIYGIPESTLPTEDARAKNDRREVGRILRIIHPETSSAFLKTHRIGLFSQAQSRPRGIKAQLGISTASEILVNSFRSMTPVPPVLAGIALTRDRTPLQQRELRTAIDELEARKQQGETNLSLSFSGSHPAVVVGSGQRGPTRRNPTQGEINATRHTQHRSEQSTSAPR